MDFNSLILKFVLAYATDKNLHALIDPYKVQLCQSMQDAANKTPGLVDDVLVKLLKVVLGVA